MRRSLSVLVLSIIAILFAQAKPTQQWLDQKYSMFIHFGLYSQYGGVYQGEPVKWGYSEQIQSFAGIFSDWYGAAAEEFNPTKWNPDEIVSLAKAAGMRSIVFTSKHHDGFCMYHSRYTSFNIVDATPYGRDLMKELADACHRSGMGFAVYYSLIDWHFPQAYPISSHNADPLTPEHFEYNMNQVREIMTNYGAISEIWFDMGCLTLEQSKQLYDLVNTLQPECMISGRLGNDCVDFSVMADNEYPDYKIGVPWQTAASMFDETWGYRSWQKRGLVSDKVDEKIRSLIKVISRGGNYLLNIGPKGDGSVVEFERDVLMEIGHWIHHNSEAIYGSKANPFHTVYEWGDITTKNDDLYLFIENPPTSGEISLSGFKGIVSSVKILSTNEWCPFIQSEKGVKIKLNSFKNDEIPVLKVAFKDGYKISPLNVIRGNELTHYNSIHTYGHSSQDYYGGYKSLIGYEWLFESHNKRLLPIVYYSENDINKVISVKIDQTEQKIALTGKDFKIKNLDKNSIHWGALYTKKGRGVFGYMPDEGHVISDETIQKEWNKVDNFKYGEKQQTKLRPRASVLFMQQINSSKDQTIAIELGSGNAVYVLLNGEYITAHFSPERIPWQKEIILLPLKSGNNQLVIKYFNRFEKNLNYSLAPLDRWKIYSQPLTPIDLSNEPSHTAILGLTHPNSKVSPIRLNNIKIRLQ